MDQHGPMGPKLARKRIHVSALDTAEECTMAVFQFQLLLTSLTDVWPAIARRPCSPALRPAPPLCTLAQMAVRAESKWGPGCDPKGIAKVYFESTRESAARLTKPHYLDAVAATAYGAMTSALSAAKVLDKDVLVKCKNILSAAKHIETLANRARELDDSDDDSDDDSNSKKASPITMVSQTVELLCQRYKKDQRRQQSGTGRSGSAGTSSAPALPIASQPNSDFPLPSAVLPAIFSSLDARSAAAAGASCKELRAAYREHAYLQLPLPFEMYIHAALDFAEPDIDLADGSLESEFVVQWPLDGSPSCGGELVRPGFEREAMLFFEQFKRMAPFPVPLPFPVQVPPPNARPAPSPYSSPLAVFKDSVPVTIAGPPDLAPTTPTSLNTPAHNTPRTTRTPPTRPSTSAASPATPNSTAAASDTGSPYTPTTTSSSSSSPSSTTTPAAAAAAAPPCSHDALTHACCDVRVLRSLCDGHAMHLDGDLLAIGFTKGGRDRDPGVQGCVLSHNADSVEGYECREGYNTGFYGQVARVCADAAHGLVWAAADDGRRIKAFRAPYPGGEEPAFGFGRTSRLQARRSLRHTLSSDVRGLVGPHAGLHVLGGSLVAVNGRGALMSWHVSRLQPQATWRPPSRVPGTYAQLYGGYDEDEEDVAYGEPEFKCNIGMRGTEAAPELEASPGVPPHAVHLLQLPVPSSSKERRRSEYIVRTDLMADPSGSAPPMLAAALEEQYGNTVMVYDMETLRVRQRLLGHLYEVTDIAVAPPSWQGAPLFATTSKTGDVKVWDVRSRCCSPAVTLAGGGCEIMEAVALARAQGGAGQLGAGMVCFAGGAGEAVWAWDLRAGRAQALYELSTGNTRVKALAWHPATNSLLASCDSAFCDPAGGNNEDDWQGWSDQQEEQAARGGRGPYDVWDSIPWWPIAAKHSRKDFKAYFNEPEWAMIQYRFSDRAARGVPESAKPSFAYAYRS